MKHLRAVNYCSWLTHVQSCTPLSPLCFRLNTPYWFQRREVGWSPQTRPQKLCLRMIKGGCICYKVMTKSPPRQLGMSVFSAALNGVCFTYSTSSQTSDLFHVSQSNKWFIVFVIIGPVTALKRQTEIKQEICVLQN